MYHAIDPDVDAGRLMLWMLLNYADSSISSFLFLSMAFSAVGTFCLAVLIIMWGWKAYIKREPTDDKGFMALGGLMGGFLVLLLLADVGILIFNPYRQLLFDSISF